MLKRVCTLESEFASDFAKNTGIVKKVGARLRELSPVTGSQEAGSSNLGHAFLTMPVEVMSISY